jgi:hypothetical protein
MAKTHRCPAMSTGFWVCRHWGTLGDAAPPGTQKRRVYDELWAVISGFGAVSPREPVSFGAIFPSFKCRGVWGPGDEWVREIQFPDDSEPWASDKIVLTQRNQTRVVLITPECYAELERAVLGDPASFG